jgi:hypothetical protein
MPLTPLRWFERWLSFFYGDGALGLQAGHFPMIFCLRIIVRFDTIKGRAHNITGFVTYFC